MTLAACSTPPSWENAPSPDSEADVREEKATWGERYTWDIGLAVEVPKPMTCEPGDFAQPRNVKRAVKVSILLVNGTPKAINANRLHVGSYAEFEGAPAETVSDSEGDCGIGLIPNGTVQPGHTMTVEMAFAVDTKPGELHLVLRHDPISDKVIYIGEA